MAKQLSRLKTTNSSPVMSNLKPELMVLCPSRSVIDGVEGFHGFRVRALAIQLVRQSLWSDHSLCSSDQFPFPRVKSGDTVVCMSQPKTSAVLDELFYPVSQCLTPDVALRIASLRVSPPLQQRMDELADKSTAGTLTAAERSEYETRVRAINFIGVLQAKARTVITADAAG